MDEGDDEEAPQNQSEMPKKLSKKEEDAHFQSLAKEYEKYKKGKPEEIPLTIYSADGKTKKTNYTKLMKDKKVCMVVNLATGCGNHKKHLEQLVELYEKYGSKGFQIIGFPSNSFS